MTDRYTKTVLTVIATAFIYLCVVITSLPAVQAQGTQRPGEPTGPLQVVIVGWRMEGETTPLPDLRSPQPLSRDRREREPPTAQTVSSWSAGKKTPRVRPRVVHSFGPITGIPIVVRST